MNQAELARFESANPTNNSAAPPADLFEAIVAGPRSAESPEPSGAGYRGGQLWRICASIVAVLVIGSGVSWAATGKPPTEFLFGFERGEGLTAGEMDRVSNGFSVLRPADQASISELSDEVLRGIQTIQVRMIPPPPRNFRGEFEGGVRLDPGTITAIGGTRTASGEVTVVAIDNQVCAFWAGGLGNCGTPAELESSGAITVGPIGPGGALTAVGLVDDQVKAIRIEGTSRPDQPVTDNIFEITNLPDRPIVLVGIDHDGHELFRRPVS